MTTKVTFLLLLISLLVLPSTTLGIAFPPEPTGGANLDAVINGILTVVWMVFVAIAIILFIVAGIKILTAEGDPNELATARRFVYWGVVGVAVALISFSIVTVVQNNIFSPQEEEEEAE